MARTDRPRRRPQFMFRAVWPVLDEAAPLSELLREATAELDEVASRAHARILTRGRFSIALSSQVPGSGRITELVLLFEAPAERVPCRIAHHNHEEVA